MELAPESWYGPDCWPDVEPCGLTAVRVAGVRALITPPWALHVCPDWDGTQARAAYIVADLPPGVEPDVACWTEVERRHTRQLDPKSYEAPKNRRKQQRKADEAGLTVQPSTPGRILALHQEARHRKGVASDGRKLEALLGHLYTSPFVHFVETREAGEGGGAAVVANAVFLEERGRMVYAFGGAIRGGLSGAATVQLLHWGIEKAREAGIEVFDFGGSMDEGVDRFYAEFGADKVEKWRCTYVRYWARPIIRLGRALRNAMSRHKR
jgi:hypothetical protein